MPSYYLRYFYFHDEVVGEEKERPSRAAEVAAIERELMELYADPDLDTKPELLSKRGGAFYSEAAVALVASLFGDGPGVAAPRAGRQRAQLRHAPVPGRRRGDRGARHDQRGRGRAGAGRADPPLLRGLIAHVSAYEELALDAALQGGRSRVAAALLAHPLVGQYDLASRMADRLIAENAQFLSWA